MFRKPSTYLSIILVIGVLLNLWGINWGLPERWHPDEMTGAALRMGYYKSLNPHHFAYGSLHYYQIMLFIAPIHFLYIAMNLYNYISELHILWLFSRVLSGLLGTCIVLITYLIAKEVFDKKSGLFSALSLTVTMGFVNISHFATSDIPSIFWFSLSCLMSSYVLTRGNKKYHLLAGLFIGFAAASKYSSGLALLALIVAHFLNRNSLHKYLLYGLLVAIVGFFAANPAIFFSSCEFIEGFLKDNFFNSTSRFNRPYAYVPFFSIVTKLRNALGSPLFFLSILGFLYSLKLVFSTNERWRILFVWSMFLPHYFLFGSSYKIPLRYLVPVVPFLLILTGKMMRDCLDFKSNAARIFSIIIFALVVSYSLLFTVAADLEFTNDSRKLAKEWINSNIEDGSTIEITSYFTALPEDKYKVISRPHNNKVDKTALLVKDSKTYLFFMSLISKYQFLAGKAGLCSGESPYYTAWYEREMNRYNLSSSNFDLSIGGLDSRGVDYLVVSSNYFKKFDRDKESPEGKFFESLFSGHSGYEEIAEFEYHFHPWIDPSPEFVNPLIRVYKKKDTDQQAYLKPHFQNNRNG